MNLEPGNGAMNFSKAKAESEATNKVAPRVRKTDGPQSKLEDRFLTKLESANSHIRLITAM